MANIIHDEILREWMDGPFREALRDDERVKQSAALIQVGRDKGDDPLDVVRHVVADFVRETIFHPPPRGSD